MAHAAGGARTRGVASILVLVAVTGACADGSVLSPDDSGRPAFSHGSTSTQSAWTAAGPGTVTLVADGTAGDAVMSYALSGGSVFSTKTWDLTTTAAQGTAVSLPWSYSGYHAYFQVRVVVQAVVNNTVVATLVNAGPVNCCTSPSGGFQYGGSYTFNVQAGDTYGFRFGGSNFDSDSRLLGTFRVDLPESPTSKAACKNGGWEAYGFRNQGQCVSFVETGHDSR